ncbi:unnamed protein product [Thlaspi arvense]|uniref:Uncharacterized protein n=1 Tax=Thlaspi arvense TaxID=13288 RepID=A0AAU9S317_THLAR|nr:unnamed protein product [Thlaspi arvense]
MFLLLEFLAVTASLFVALLQTTGNHGILTLINGGDFGVPQTVSAGHYTREILLLVVSSIVDLVGIILCLHAAAKITHRAQRIASVASRWHTYLTCNSSTASQIGATSSGENLEAGAPADILPMYYSESDLESTDFIPMPQILSWLPYVFIPQAAIFCYVFADKSWRVHGLWMDN